MPEDKRTEAVKKRRRKTNADYKRVFSQSPGKDVLFDLMKKVKFHEPAFDENPHLMAFNNGQRSLIAIILREINLDLEAFEKLVKEAYEHERIGNSPDGWE